MISPSHTLQSRCRSAPRPPKTAKNPESSASRSRPEPRTSPEQPHTTRRTPRAKPSRATGRSPEQPHTTRRAPRAQPPPNPAKPPQKKRPPACNKAPRPRKRPPPPPENGGARRTALRRAPPYASADYASRLSRICTAFRAAPLRIWSLTHQKARPFSSVRSLRMRPTQTGSHPARKSGIG